MASHLARIGVAVFALALSFALVTEHPAAGRGLVASAATLDLPSLREIAPIAIDLAATNVAVAGTERAPAAAASVVEAPVAPAITVAAPVASAPAPAAAVAPAPAAPVAPALVAAPVLNDAIVLASWYGPGFYGNTTACGQHYTPEIMGVAHLTLRCGTMLTLTYGSRSIAVPVIDRGPYIAGRTLDLSNATKLALGCTDLCTLRMQIRP
jgi:rare lipoprotein A (peptidoglycan hydrolase)